MNQRWDDQGPNIDMLIDPIAHMDIFWDGRGLGDPFQDSSHYQELSACYLYEIFGTLW